MKVNPQNPNHYWFMAHFGTDDINPDNKLLCDICLKVMGKYELSDYEVQRGFICNECVKENKK